MAFATETEQVLRDNDLRVTRPRVAVLDLVRENPHSDTGSIIDLVRERIGDVSHQAVYDVLRVLTEAGLLRHIQPSGSVARYESRIGDNHHHVVCRNCGAVADVDCVTGAAPCMEGSNHHGYEIDECEVTFWGICPACQADRAGKERPKEKTPKRKEVHA
jgi:Fe2+ or Zn2+ uptake regulation protein